MPLVPFLPRPGLVLTESEYAAEGRWVDADKTRFHRGRPEKIGGCVRLDDNDAFLGKVRGLIGARTNDGHAYVAFGSHLKLYVWQEGVLTDITPLDTSGTLGTDPIRVTTGSGTATITHTSHGRSPGDYVHLGTATGTSTTTTTMTVGGVAIGGAYSVLNAPNANTYTIGLAGTATATATGGGTAALFEYEIGVGRESTIPGYGFGVGAFGNGDFGTQRTESIPLFARTWTLDTFGEDLLALHRNGKLYVWDYSAGARATIVSNAPTGARAMFVSDDKKVHLLGPSSDSMKMQWSDTADYTTWTPTDANDAGSKQLSGGAELLAGARGSGYQLIWSDTDVFVVRNLYNELIYDVRSVGNMAGIIGPLAWAEMEGRHYWMGPHGFFVFDGVQLSPIPNQDDVRQRVYGDMNRYQAAKFHAGANPQFREIWFWYCSAGSGEIDRYVVFDADDRVWTWGTWARTAYRYTSARPGPLGATTDGYLVEHESGHDDMGSAMDSYVKSAPVDIGDGDQRMQVSEFYPDMERLTGQITWSFYTKEYPNEDEVLDDQVTVDDGTDKESLRVSGRQVAVKIRSNEAGGDWRIGRPRIWVQTAGRRR